jgi:hypothetical protein
MSMYEMMHGVNPFAAYVMGALGFTNPTEQVPRLRDAYVDLEGNLVVFTRAGGNNRHSTDLYPLVQQLEARPGWLRTEDWDVDSTYAKFVYAPPEEHAELLAQLAALGARMDPTQRHKALMEDMRAPKPKPSTRAALERAQPLMDQIAKALDK